MDIIIDTVEIVTNPGTQDIVKATTVTVITSPTALDALIFLSIELSSIVSALAVTVPYTAFVFEYLKHQQDEEMNQELNVEIQGLRGDLRDIIKIIEEKDEALKTKNEMIELLLANKNNPNTNKDTGANDNAPSGKRERGIRVSSLLRC